MDPLGDRDEVRTIWWPGDGGDGVNDSECSLEVVMLPGHVGPFPWIKQTKGCKVTLHNVAFLDTIRLVDIEGD